VKNLLLVIGILIVGFFAYRAWQASVFNTASDMAQDVFPVWAGQGPFDNGTDSAVAMWAAWSVVYGPDKAQQNTDSFIQHQQAYDADPATWAGLQQETSQQFGDPDGLVPKAKSLALDAAQNGELEWLGSTE
jgi:hypothetical protein